jgi:allene oxide cyclase
MSWKIVALVVAVLVSISIAAGAAGATVGAQKGRPQTTDGETLRFAVKFSPLFLLDLGRHGLSKGDQIVENDRLLNASGTRAGHDGFACTITDASVPEAACQGTFVMRGGQITVQFLNSPPSVKIGAITGGTGRFRTARGQMRLVEPATGNVGRVTFSLTGS